MEPSKEDPSIGSVVGDGRALSAGYIFCQDELGDGFEQVLVVVRKRLEEFGGDVWEGPSVHGGTLAALEHAVAR
jgi:hypothetical protein